MQIFMKFVQKERQNMGAYILWEVWFYLQKILIIASKYFEEGGYFGK